VITFATDGKVRTWGNNEHGQLGTVTVTGFSADAILIYTDE